MRSRHVAAFVLTLLVLASPASAQYMKITTDNPTDNTRMRASGTTILTLTLDTNHDRNGSLQTCNSHTIANCGAPSSAEPLDMFSYTLAIQAVGGTVQWGTFSAADANYVDLIPQIQSNTEVEINQARPAGSSTPPGLATLGTLPVTVLSGSPSIGFQVGPTVIDPSGFGTGFGTHCDAFNFANTYTLGDPADPCGNTNGIAGDWFDWDGARAPDLPPVLNPIANMSFIEGSTKDQAISGSDPDGDALTFAKVAGPTFMTVTTTSTTTGNIHLAPGFADAGAYSATVSASDGTLSDSKSFTLTSTTNRAPVLNPISNMSLNVGGCAASTADQAISGSDPDGDALTFSKVAGPTFMTVTTTSPTTGNIHLAPGSGDSGFYPATARASDGTLSNDKSFSINIALVNQGPTLNQPANMAVIAGATADQQILGSDPCAQPLTFIKVSGPTFMTVTTINGTTGNIHLAPSLSEAGTFFGTVRATNGTLFNDKNFTITVNNPNDPPTLNPIANMQVCEGSTADQTITATDPDGNAINFIKTAGPTFMTVTTTTPGTGSATGNIHLAPGFADAGAYTATVTASDGSLSSNPRSFSITVGNGCRAPVLDPVADMTVVEGGTADQAISGSDPDGDALTFSKVTGPIYMTVSTTSPTTGNIHLAPGLADAGTAMATVSASDGALTSSRTFTITVLTSGNRCPASNPGGPYSGIAGVPIAMNGSGSSDPDGNPLSYSWDFDASNGITVDATGAMVNHTYAAAGTFTVTLTVTDNGDGDPTQICSNSATTTASISAACDATVFNGYDTIRLGSGKPFWYAYVQPATACYANSDVIVSSFVMKYAGRQISASGKTSVGGDKSGDGIAEIKVNFSKDDLRTLFTGTGLTNGHNSVTVTLEASLVTGGLLRGTTTLDVVNNGSFTVATVSPNPLNPEATLTYTTTRSGPVRIDLFDIQGRLVKRIVDDPAMAAGLHQATVDGRGAHGEKLASGVYYIRGFSNEGEFKQVVTILK